MGKLFLRPVFRDIFEMEYSGNETDQKLMQSITYLLQANGVELDPKYKFLWYSNGPFSQVLKNDLETILDISYQRNIYSEYAMEQLLNIRYILEQPTSYSTEEWANCLACVSFIKENFFNKGTDKKVILDELEKRRPNLNDNEANALAFSLVSKNLWCK